MVRAATQQPAIDADSYPPCLGLSSRGEGGGDVDNMANLPYFVFMVESADRRDLFWVGSSLEDLKKLPEQVQDVFGHGLDEAQRGETPVNAVSMKGLSGVFELRDNFDTDTYRAVYIAKLKNGLYVLHVFQKKSKHGIATPKKDMEIIRQRFKEAVREDAS